MEFISKKLDDYICAHTSEEPNLLYELNRETHLNVLQPRMLSGHFQGRVLSMLSKMIQPKDILEIGTYTGYSALCFAEGLAEGGHIITIDKNEELEDLVHDFVSRSEYKDQIKCMVGDAMKIVPQLKRSFDLVFIDADKGNYLNYYSMVMNKIRKGGYIIIDNVLWSGKVLDKVQDNDEDTKVLIELNKTIHEDSRVEEVLLPIRDGLFVVRVK
ncbi:class I SAM-dependent methyltransferase [Crocinitomicaceae bacterium]|jgi:predicted O-methyltransferase YrrM|nr:class I SAM-dependent methyltransferase [Crocinitomicaceae bacterium]MDG1035219.1 class I SAM-dependent methyltransferase [Crocinitomicaceae bacterium]